MTYTGKRFSPSAVEVVEPPKKGIVECKLCGRRIRPSARKKPHENTGECLAQQVVNAYAARGWTQLHNVTASKIVEESGAPFEWALGACHVETKPIDGFGKTEDVMVQHNVGFAPEAVARVMALVSQVRDCPPSWRRKAIKSLWPYEDLVLALDSAIRLRGANLRAFLHQSVVEAERRHGASTEPS